MCMYLLYLLFSFLCFVSKDILQAQHKALHKALHPHHHHWNEDIIDYHVQKNNLSNSQVVISITTSFKLYRNRIIPSMRTWMKFFPKVFIVLEDTRSTRIENRHCRFFEHDEVTSVKCPKEPMYILTRNCSDDYYVADGICCKYDSLITYLTKYRLALLERTKYFLFIDDDTYLRSAVVFDWLSLIDIANIDNIPIIGNGACGGSHENSPGIFNSQKCYEIFTYGWYQPLLLNKLALEKFGKIAPYSGITETCKAFELSQDGGLGVVGWLLELYHISMPGMREFIKLNQLVQEGEDVLLVHHTKESELDDCEGINWPASLRYDQSMILGCGNETHPSPFHNNNVSLNMYDVHQYYVHLNKTIRMYNDSEDIAECHYLETNNVTGIRFPVLVQLDGYNTTRHYRNNNILQKWKPYTLDDCEINVERRTKKLV